MTVKKHHVVEYTHMRQLRLAPQRALHVTSSWGEPHMISQTVIVSVCPSVQRTFTFRIYACSNLTQVCNISLVQSACYSASADSTSTVHAYLQRESKDVIDSTPSQQKRDRPGYSRDVIDSTPSHQKRDKPGYSRDVIDSTQSHQKRDRPGYRKDVIDSTLSQQKRHMPGYSKDVIDSTLSQQKRHKPGYSKDVIDSTLSQQKRDKPKT